MRARDVAYRPVAIDRDPFLDSLLDVIASAHEMVVDVVETFGPCIEAFLLKFNELGTEATPESLLTIATNAALIKLHFYGVSIGDLMFPLKMFLESLSAIGCLGAGTTFEFFFIASPSL